MVKKIEFNNIMTIIIIIINKLLIIMTIFIKTKKMNDLFSVVQEDINTNLTISSEDYLNKIMTHNDITKLNINWSDVLHTFYQNQLIFNDDIIKLISGKIHSILNDTLKSSSSATINNIDNIHRFLHLNAIFEILNELNSSYNQTIDVRNYTLKIFQTFYLNELNNSDNINLLNHWFDGIYNINLELFDGKHKSKYHKAIEILKKYLDLLSESENCLSQLTKRNQLINNFIANYAKCMSTKLTENYKNNKLNLSSVFDKLTNFDDINKFFINNVKLRSDFLNLAITNLVPCWEIYLSDILINNLMIDEKIVNTFNSVDLINTNFHNITISFMELWYSNIKLSICPKNYGNSKLFESLRKICPLINLKNGNNKSQLIVKYIKDLFLLDGNFLGYIMTGLNILIKKCYNEYNTTKQLIITSNIKYTLALISLYDNKEEIWNAYFKCTYNRIMATTKKMRINKTLINFELDIFNQLILNGCGASSDKTKSLLNNIKNSIDHLNVIHKLQVNYKKNDGSDYDSFVGPEISKIDYTIFDKYIWETENNDKIKYNLIEQSKYPNEIKTYLSIGKSYFDIVSETNMIEWDVEYSVINYNIGQLNIVSNIIQYTILSTVLSASKTSTGPITKEQLINYIVTKDILVTYDAKKYIESYISYMISKDIIVLSNGKLCINTAFADLEFTKSLFDQSCLIDISDFKPALNIEAINTTQIKSKNTIEENANANANAIEENEIQENKMTEECLSYLRIMMLIKMFKQNSTTIFTLNTILNRLSEHTTKYVSSEKLSQSLQPVFSGLVNVTDNQLIMELKSLEKRDIIEETKKGSMRGYIYVV